MICTYALHDVDPFAWLTDTMDKLAASWPANRLDELLSDAYAARRASETSQASE